MTQSLPIEPRTLTLRTAQKGVNAIAWLVLAL
jgi:hypothetical protein